MSTIFELPETQLRRRGHVFFGDELKQAPALYETEDVSTEDKIVVARYFGGSGTWLICEVDPESSVAFGWCDLGLGYPEFGYVNLHELESLNAHGGLIIIERDLHFEPTRFGDLPQYQR